MKPDKIFTTQDLVSMRITVRAQRSFLDAIPLPLRKMPFGGRTASLRKGEAQ